MGSDPMPRLIWMLVFPDFTLLDLAGPYEVFARMPDVEISLLWRTRGPIRSDTGWKVRPDHTFQAAFEESRKPDVLFVPGGPGQQRLMECDETLGFLRAVAPRSTYLCSVCTGSLVLAGAGLLTGYLATTHWMFLDILGILGAKPVNERVAVDRNRITGAGVSAGIDMALRVTAMLCGEAIAKDIQLLIEYEPDPPFDCGSPQRAEREVVERVVTKRREIHQARTEQARRIAQRWKLAVGP